MRRPSMVARLPPYRPPATPVHAGFEPLVEGFVRVPLNDIAALEEVARASERDCRVPGSHSRVKVASIPPCRIPASRAPAQARLAAHARRSAMRHGPYRQMVCPPMDRHSARCDALGQGLGSGVPIGAVVCGPKAANVLQPGNHGTTFGGNPWPCAPGWKPSRSWKKTNCWPMPNVWATDLMTALRKEVGNLPGVVEFRGQGLMIGMELDRPCGVILTRAMEAGLLLSVTSDKVIRLLPPLIFTTEQSRPDCRPFWLRWCVNSCRKVRPET